MSINSRILIIMIVLLMMGDQLQAQSKLKGGVGLNYISNNFPEDQLYDYVPFSFHLSYTIFRHQNFSVALESATSYRKKVDDGETRLGLTTSLPLTLQYHLNRSLIYAGSGPAYLKQKASGYSYLQSVSGPYLNMMAGIGIGSRSNPVDVVSTEYNIRLSILKSFRSDQEHVAMVSFIIFLRGAR